MKSVHVVSLVLLVLSLTGCGSGNPYEDLDEYMAEVKARPGGRVQPIPPIKTYKPFNYSASGLRSPFVRPVEVKEIAQTRQLSNAKPDPSRPKEFLEQFSVDSLAMVGSLELSGIRWALIRDTEGGVHRVKVGNYLGRNFGKIVESSETHLVIVELVPGGEDVWIERPRTLELRTNE